MGVCPRHNDSQRSCVQRMAPFVWAAYTADDPSETYGFDIPESKNQLVSTATRMRQVISGVAGPGELSARGAFILQAAYTVMDALRQVSKTGQASIVLRSFYCSSSEDAFEQSGVYRVQDVLRQEINGDAPRLFELAPSFMVQIHKPNDKTDVSHTVVDCVHRKSSSLSRVTSMAIMSAALVDSNACKHQSRLTISDQQAYLPISVSAAYTGQGHSWIKFFR